MLHKNLSIFKLVPASEFSPANLDEYPVWSEFYDPDEREDIVGWGVDAAWLERELEARHHGSDHAMYPLLETDPFPPRMRIYIKAHFETPSGHKLSGYIINTDAYAIGVFYRGKEFIFNRNLPGHDVYIQRDRAALQKLLDDPSDPIFPVRYQTDFTDENGRRIEGTFALKE